MPSVDTKIWLALKSRLDGLAALVGLPISWPNESFTAPAGGYLRVSHVPNTPGRVFLGTSDPHDRMGVVPVMVLAKRGWTEAMVREVAGKIAAHFSPDLVMSYDGVLVRVRQAPRVGAVVNPADSSYAECIVEIQYRSFA